MLRPDEQNRFLGRFRGSGIWLELSSNICVIVCVCKEHYDLPLFYLVSNSFHNDAAILGDIMKSWDSDQCNLIVTMTEGTSADSESTVELL